MKTLTINGQEYTGEDVVSLMRLTKQFINGLESEEDKALFRRKMTDRFTALLMQMGANSAEIADLLYRPEEGGE